jgi:hypothetical protein
VRRHNVMRIFSKTLTGICLLFALIVQSEPVSAGNVYIRAGAEGVGQDAWLELIDADQFSLGLVGCKKSRGKLDLQLVLSVYGKGQVPSELEALRSTEVDTTLGLDFCINGICEDNEFRSEAREWGNVLLKDITIDRNQEKIRSMCMVRIARARGRASLNAIPASSRNTWRARSARSGRSCRRCNRRCGGCGRPRR